MKTTNIRDIVGANIKYYRFLLGVTQEQLAEKCDLSAKYISDIENSRGNIPIDTVAVLAQYFEIQPYLLLKEEKHPQLPKRVNMKK